jgi:iron complex outermembrane receptor protein
MHITCTREHVSKWFDAAADIAPPSEPSPSFFGHTMKLSSASHLSEKWLRAPSRQPRCNLLFAGFLAVPLQIIASEAQAAAAPTGATTSLELEQIDISASEGAARVPTFEGGQVAKTSNLGLLGDKQFLDIPFSVTSYTAKLIEDQQAVSLADLVVNDASVRSVSPRYGYKDRFAIRGFLVNGSDVSFDGLYGIAPFDHVVLDAVERVDIMRGPNALLNGITPNGVVGGGINLVPKRAPEQPLQKITLDYGFDQRGVRGDFARRFGEDKAFGARINIASRAGDTPVDHQSQHIDNLAVALDYQAARWRATVDLGIQSTNSIGLPGSLSVLPGVNIPHAPDARKNFFQPWSYAKTRDKYGMGRFEYDIAEDLTVYAAGGYKDYQLHSLDATTTLISDSGDTRATASQGRSQRFNATGEVGAKWRTQTGAVGHTVNVGYSAYRGLFGFTNQSLGALGTSNIYQPAYAQKPNTVSIPDPYEQYKYNFNSFALSDTLALFDDRVNIIIAGRQQRVETQRYSAAGTTLSTYDESTVSPAYSVLFHPSEHSTLYASMIEGLTQGDTAPTTAANAGEMFTPYKSRQYEAGFKYDQGDWGGSIAAFQITKPSAYLNAASNVYSVDGEQRNRGLEFSVFGQLAPGLTTLSGLTLLDARLTRTAGGAYDDNRAPGVSKVNFNAGLDWQLPQLPAVSLNSQVMYTSSQYYDQANTQKLPDWVRLDVGGAWRANKTVTVRAGVQNVFGKDYWANAVTGALTQGAPRTYLLSTTLDF